MASANDGGQGKNGQVPAPAGAFLQDFECLQDMEGGLLSNSGWERRGLQLS